MNIPKLPKAILLFLTTLFLIFVTARPSPAHWADLAVGEMTIEQQAVQFVLTIPTGLVSFADTDGNQQLNDPEIQQHQAKLKEFLNQRLRLTNQQAATGTLQITAANPIQSASPSNTTLQTHSTLRLNYQWPKPLEDLTLHYDLFVPGVSTARCLVTTIQGNKTQSLVFTPTEPTFSLIQRPALQQIYSFMLLGIEHILTGYDHILFLLSLLLVSKKFKDLLKIVTAFTVSHSVTLTLAVLNIVTLPSQWVECAIALSIIYVAIENIWRKNFQHRWFLTFGFGLIHGLGFAGILKDFNLSQSNLAISMVSFNLGVELGQIAIVSLCFGMLLCLRQIRFVQRFQASLLKLASGGIMVIGGIWFVQRAFF